MSQVTAARTVAPGTDRPSCPPPPRGREAADGVTFLTASRPRRCGSGWAAGGKNLEVFSPTVSRELLELGLIDEIELHVAPVLLGEGIRPCDNPGSEPIRLHRVGEGYPAPCRVLSDSRWYQAMAGRTSR